MIGVHGVRKIKLRQGKNNEQKKELKVHLGKSSRFEG